MKSGFESSGESRRRRGDFQLNPRQWRSQERLGCGANGGMDWNRGQVGSGKRRRTGHRALGKSIVGHPAGVMTLMVVGRHRGCVLARTCGGGRRRHCQWQQQDCDKCQQAKADRRHRRRISFPCPSLNPRNHGVVPSSPPSIGHSGRPSPWQLAARCSSERRIS